MVNAFQNMALMTFEPDKCFLPFSYIAIENGKPAGAA